MVAFPVLLSLGLPGCYKDPKFSTTPVISFKEIRKFPLAAVPSQIGLGKRDSVVISIDFQDGDGDIGVTNAQLEEERFKGKHNFKVRFFIKRNGSFQEISRSPTDSGNIFPLLAGGKSGPIEGVISKTIGPILYDLPIAPSPSVPALNDFPKNDTIYFMVKLIDRELQESNEIQTSEIIINQK